MKHHINPILLLLNIKVVLEVKSNVNVVAIDIRLATMSKFTNENVIQMILELFGQQVNNNKSLCV
jgi:hypothetical protein